MEHMTPSNDFLEALLRVSYWVGGRITKKRNPESSHTQMCFRASLLKEGVMSHANVELICKQYDNCVADVSLQSNSPKLS